MDAYDIFKKLTKGLSFSSKNKMPKDRPELAKENVPVLHEIGENEVVKTPKKRERDDSIMLMSGMNHGEKPEGKKRKLLSEEQLESKKLLLEKEEVNHYRNLNNISVVGRRVPNPARSFEDLNVDKDIVSNLIKCGYDEPTPIQKQAVPIMLEKRSLLACAPTGSGKTAAFLIPIIHHLKTPQRQGFRALILCPTRELASQTQRECLRLSEGRGLKIHIISKVNKAISQYGPKSNQNYDILITTPNRLCYLLKQDPPGIQLGNVQWLVIDEADKLFEDGSRSFRDQLNQVLEACNNNDRKIAMFSATHTPVVAKWCVHNMPGLIRVTVGQRNAATDTVDQKLQFVGSEQGKLIALRDLIRQGITPPVLIFVQSKDRAQQLFNELIYDGIMVDVIHADRTQTQRDNVVKCFREGKIWVLICTELMARGIDFKGINLVINYDFPPSAISYVHRIGRAGRAGRRGQAVTFFTEEDTPLLRSIAYIVKESGCEIPEYLLTLKKKSKKEAKKMAKKAPARDDITTVPLYDRIKGGKKKKFREIEKRMRDKDPKSKKNGKINKNNKKNNVKVKKISFKKKPLGKLNKSK
ncbi:probable ATP-dependent RNA helicase DDX52 isoform X2 [Anthonomus grandis grandis]|uniref:probable ATP-dependent RNA helicase DDX52 isoform X2 n=1 Tax=Anthonomus grandis grandis TaxID=2921223 RepID=UPI002166A571|nr:probable ATP-dependent RNA helicase DDX52 isoform X2 [Anthonomus grandis grandis]